VDNSLTADDLAGFSVTSAELAPNSVDSGKIVDGSVVLADLAANSVNSGTIVDGSIVAADVNTGFINFVTITDGSSGWNPDGATINFSVTGTGAGSSSRVVVTVDDSSVATTCGVYDHSGFSSHFFTTKFFFVPTIEIHCDIAPSDGSILLLMIAKP